VTDFIKVRISANPGESFLDRMIALVEGAERQKTPNEIALNILLAGLTLIFLIVVATLRPVSDAGTLQLNSRFYEARGNTDPVGVLARIQAKLATTDNKDWPYFAVFGNEICKR